MIDHRSQSIYLINIAVSICVAVIIYISIDTYRLIGSGAAPSRHASIYVLFVISFVRCHLANRDGIQEIDFSPSFHARLC